LHNIYSKIIERDDVPSKLVMCRKQHRIGEKRMEVSELDEERVKELFKQGHDCSQVVLSHYAKDLNIDEDMARKVSACFGGGMMIGETCGAITGALMAMD
jgi:hypothetical protein